jgi:hypothetical protein
MKPSAIALEQQLHAFCIFDEEQEEYLCGFIDSEGNVVIPPKYEVAEDFSEGLALVAEYGWGRAYGFINTFGEVVIPPLEGITVLGAFHEGLCVVEVDGKSGYINKTGTMAIVPQFDAAYDFKHGVALVSADADSDDYWGFIDKTGKVIVPLKYRRAEPPTFWYTDDGLLRLLDGNETCYFDTTGKQIWPQPAI